MSGTILGPDAGSGLSVPGLSVGQLAPLLAHGSYAAEGPVNRVDGDAQRWGCSGTGPESRDGHFRFLF